MILNLKQLPINVLLPENCSAQFDDAQKLTPFGDEIIATLSQLGLFLMKTGRQEPSIVAAGYWLRKKPLLNLKLAYAKQEPSAKGVAFHIAPGNVDSLFFYSMIISVLCGNYTILRISNKLSDETRLFIHLLNTFFVKHPEFSAVRSLMNIVQYDHNGLTGKEITQQLSLFADVRVIWGGDSAVKEISKVPLKALACDITFPDRYSVAVIQLTNEQQIEKAVDNLLSDITLFYQQACSSPKVIYWLKTAQELQNEFWRQLSSKLNEKVKLTSANLISQLVYLQRLPLLLGGNVSKNKVMELITSEGDLKLVYVEIITLEMINNHTGNYVLLHQNINDFSEILLFKHCQTVTMFGVNNEVWQQWLASTTQPMKRWVVAGSALGFSHHWDGIDLIDCLTLNSLN